jgi:putative phosphoribosyl transferase
MRTMSVEQLNILSRVSAPRPAFSDRAEAGRMLAELLVASPDPRAAVLVLPRGGVPVGEPVAAALGCSLTPFAVRKLPIPSAPEMGFGAVTLDGTVTLNHAVMRSFGISIGQASVIAEKVKAEVARRAQAYPGAESVPRLDGRRVFIIDDGLATGYTMIAAAEAVRQREPAELVIAVPVAPISALLAVAEHCDRAVCMIAQESGSFAVASFYQNFPDLDDDEVRTILARSSVRTPAQESQ